VTLQAASAQQESLADLLARPGVSLGDQGDRDRIVATLTEQARNRVNDAHARARLMGLPVRRVWPDGVVQKVVGSAKGMAPSAKIDSYDWNNDIAEMASRAATEPGPANNLDLSNHSYNFVTGWNYVYNGIRVWKRYGDGNSSTAIERDFGHDHSSTRDQDSLVYNAPDDLIFRSAGNEKTDNPAAGKLVALLSGSSSVVTFDPALHPSGDGQYRGGFETIGFAALAKNIVTIGSASDAVTAGFRDLLKANVSVFSSWGPADDGRIKPELVANGEAVYSPLPGSNSAYGSYWGTSMATPNACGSTALLLVHYGNLFSGGALRASSMKGLLIDTADDRGSPGPDYRYGWGLVNAMEAADLISDFQSNSERQGISENTVSTAVTSKSLIFFWDGVSPIRATLCWTDPAGNATSISDLRSPRLSNDLDVTSSGSGTVFASNGYQTSIRSGRRPSGRSDFAGLQAWSGDSNGFREVIVNLTDQTKFSGNNGQLRWVLTTTDGTGGGSRHLDSISLI